MEKYLSILKRKWKVSLILSIIGFVITVIVAVVRADKSVMYGKQEFYWMYCVMALMIFLVVYAEKRYKRQLKKMQTMSLADKLVNYDSALIKKTGCYHTIGILTLLAEIFTGQIPVLLFGVLAIFLIIIKNILS